MGQRQRGQGHLHGVRLDGELPLFAPLRLQAETGLKTNLARVVPTMHVWWLLSAFLIALMLKVLILAGTMPSVLRAVSAVSVLLWTTALVYFVVRRW